MGQFQLVYLFIAYSIGIAFIGIALIVYARTRVRLIGSFLFLYSAFTLFVIATGFGSYVENTLPIPGVLTVGLLHYSNALSILFLSYAIFSSCHSILGVSYRRTGNVASAILVAAALLAYLVEGGRRTLIPFLLLALSNVYSFAVGVVRFRSLDPRVSRFLRPAFYLWAVLIPVIFIPLIPPIGAFRWLAAPLLQQSPAYAFPVLYLGIGFFYVKYSIQEYLQNFNALPALSEEKKKLFYQDNRISTREAEIIALVLIGLGNKAIGERLFISLPTVKKHVSSVFRKLGICTRFALIRRIDDIAPR